MFLAFIFVGLCFGERRLLQETSTETPEPPTAEQQISALITSQDTVVSEGLFVKCYIYHNYLNPTSSFWLASDAYTDSNLDTPVDTLMSNHIADEPWYVQISEQMNQAPFSALTVSDVADEFSSVCSVTSAVLLQQVRTTLNCAIQAEGVPDCPQTPEEWVALVPECATALETLEGGNDPGLNMQEKMQCARIILSTIFIGGIVDLSLIKLEQTANGLLAAAAVNDNEMMAAQQTLAGTTMLASLDELDVAMGLGESFVQAAITSEEIAFTLQNFNLCSILQYAGYTSNACPAAGDRL